jgi:hypothetical protein
VRALSHHSKNMSKGVNLDHKRTSFNVFIFHMQGCNMLGWHEFLAIHKSSNFFF